MLAAKQLFLNGSDAIQKNAIVAFGFLTASPFTPYAFVTYNNGVNWDTYSLTVRVGSYHRSRYGNGIFCAGALNSSTLYNFIKSTDLLNWQQATTQSYNDTGGDLGSNNLIYANNKFFNLYDTGTVTTSTDGLTWSLVGGSSNIDNANWTSIAYGNGVYVIVGNNRQYVRYTSNPQSGTIWTASSNVFVAGLQIESIVYDNGIFLVTIENSNIVYTSSDALTWTLRTLPSSRQWNPTIYAASKWIIIESAGSNQYVTSTDTITWTSRSFPVSDGWLSVDYSNGIISVIGSQYLLISSDGITWTSQTLPLSSTVTYESHTVGRVF
jgi:hypothetical protein